MVEAYGKLSQDSVGLNTTDFEANLPVLAGVVFTSKFKDGGSAFADNIEVSFQ